MTDLRLVVGGLLTRDPLLGTLLLNYAARLGAVRPEDGDPAAPSFIVPDWIPDDRPSAPAGSRLFTVEAHVPRDTPHAHRRLDAVLDTVHRVLTGAGDAFSTRRLEVTAVVGIGDGTVSRTGTWELVAASAAAPATSPAAEAYRGTPPGAASSSR